MTSCRPKIFPSRSIESLNISSQIILHPLLTWGIILLKLYSVETNVKWHGARAEYFRPQRGIRQGDPISPYLFVLCMDKLSHLITHAVNNGDWKTLRAGRNGPLVSHLMFADDLLLFGEATERQMNCLMDILKSFCNMSGQEVSYEKTSILFSKNVSREMRNNLVQRSGFRETNQLGKYLGVPLTGKAPQRVDFQYIIDQVSAKLASWKANQLSFAGRVTLAKSVVEAIPIYPMMTSCIPKGCLEEINKLQRKFIWGDTNDVKKHHAVRWDVITMPKNSGGLGLRKLDVMNQACLLKLGWKLNSGSRDLWCEVLRGKYNCQVVAPDTEVKVSDSNLWRNIVKLSPNLNKYCFWAIGDGRTVGAWSDAWIDRGMRVDELGVYIPDNIKHVKVCDLVDMNGDWNWHFIRDWMPTNIINKIAAILPPADINGEDQRIGAGNGSSDFSVSDMYSILCEYDHDHDVDKWGHIWKLQVAERIKYFMWLVIHNRLLTNTNSTKAKMNLGHAMCNFCRDVEETILHAFRDCALVKQLWLSIVPFEARGSFFGGDLVLVFNCINTHHRQ